MPDAPRLLLKPSSPRRGVGIHFVPAEAKFKPTVGKLWVPLKADGSDALPDELLPVVWSPPPA